VGKTLVGILADTHGLIRQEAISALQGCDLILHAGDVGKPEVLVALEQIAPLTAIRGNVDHGAWAESLPAQTTVEIHGVRLHLIHDLNDLAIDPIANGFSALISGHSHRPSLKIRDSVHLINPGSAGPRRFRLPISIALLVVEDGLLYPTLVEL
jgi:putative phosphoesterase